MRPEAATGSTACTRPWLLVSAAFVRTGGQDRANLALASYLARQNCPLHIVAHRVADDGEGTAFLRHDQPGDTALARQLAHQRDYHEWARDGRRVPVLEEAFDRLAATAINSIAQHAKPIGMGHMELFRIQLTASSNLVGMTLPSILLSKASSLFAVTMSLMGEGPRNLPTE